MEEQFGTKTEQDCILIVEDEMLLAEELVRSLQEWGYNTCERVRTGDEAVATVLGGHVGLILMDIKLEGPMDGIEAAKRIKAFSDVPLVYLTAFADHRTLARAKVTMPHGYLLKPFRSGELKAVIEMAFYKARMEKSHRTRMNARERGTGDLPAEDRLLRICSHCKRIRKEDDAWEIIEEYLYSRFDVECSHSICPECAKTFYPDYDIY